MGVSGSEGLGGETELALAQLLVVEPPSGVSGFWTPGKLRELLPAGDCPPLGGAPVLMLSSHHVCVAKISFILKCRYLWKNKTTVSHPCVYVICSVRLLHSCHPAGVEWPFWVNGTMWGMDAG